MLKCDRTRLEMIRRIQIGLSIDDLDIICMDCNTESLSRYDIYFWTTIGFFLLTYRGNRFLSRWLGYKNVWKAGLTEVS